MYPRFQEIEPKVVDKTNYVQADVTYQFGWLRTLIIRIRISSKLALPQSEVCHRDGLYRFAFGLTSLVLLSFLQGDAEGFVEPR